MEDAQTVDNLSVGEHTRVDADEGLQVARAVVRLGLRPPGEQLRAHHAKDDGGLAEEADRVAREALLGREGLADVGLVLAPVDARAVLGDVRLHREHRSRESEIESESHELKQFIDECEKNENFVVQIGQSDIVRGTKRTSWTSWCKNTSWKMPFSSLRALKPYKRYFRTLVPRSVCMLVHDCAVWENLRVAPRQEVSFLFAPEMHLKPRFARKNKSMHILNPVLAPLNPPRKKHPFARIMCAVHPLKIPKRRVKTHVNKLAVGLIVGDPRFHVLPSQQDKRGKQRRKNRFVALCKHVYSKQRGLSDQTPKPHKTRTSAVFP